MYTMVSC